MSNFNPWYYAGIIILSVSFLYLIFSTAQFMGLKKGQSSALDSKKTSFVQHAFLAVMGFMVGAQLLQLPQDKQESSNTSIAREISMKQALNNKPAGVLATGTLNPLGAIGVGTRPTSRPPRGEFSVSEVKKTEAAIKISPAVQVAEPLVAPVTIAPNNVISVSIATSNYMSESGKPLD